MGAAPTQEAFDDAAIGAMRGSGDAITHLRNKTPGFRNTAQALERNLQRQIQIINDPSASYQARSAAMESMKITMADIQQIDADRAYATRDNQQVINELAETVNAPGGLIEQADAIISAQPNADEHQADLVRFRASRAVTPEMAERAGLTLGPGM